MSEEKEKKNKKIEEIDSAIKKSVETMNGESSLYVKHLRERKAELLAKK